MADLHVATDGFHLLTLGRPLIGHLAGTRAVTESYAVPQLYRILGTLKTCGV